jgi:hypothetical protein
MIRGIDHKNAPQKRIEPMFMFALRIYKEDAMNMNAIYR